MVARAVVDDIEAKYWAEHQVGGICFNRVLTPEGYGFGTGADNALFTGFALAAAAFKYGVTGAAADLERISETLAGIHTLTHVSGTPGVLCRLAFPLDRAAQIGYDPANTDPLNTWTRRAARGQVYENDGHFFYTRTTRDQLAGIVFGLSVAWHVLESSGLSADLATSNVVGNIVSDLATRLRSTGWSLQDHTGDSGKVTATRPLPRLRYALEQLDHVCNGTPLPRWGQFRLRMFYKYLNLHTFYYAYGQQDYVWSYRVAIALSLAIIAPDDTSRRGASRWLQRCGEFTQVADNAWLVFAEQFVTRLPLSPSRVQRAQAALDHLATVGHNGYFAWQKAPENQEPAGTNGTEGTGLDVLLPYWMQQYYAGSRQ